MMRDAEKTVGTMIDKQKTAFIGFHRQRRISQYQSHVATPEKGRDKNDLSDNEYFVNACCTIPEEQSCLYLLL